MIKILIQKIYIIYKLQLFTDIFQEDTYWHFQKEMLCGQQVLFNCIQQVIIKIGQNFLENTQYRT